MKRIKTGLTGFILGDWLGMPYRGKGKGTFKPLYGQNLIFGEINVQGIPRCYYVLWTVVAIWNFISRI